MHPIIYIAGPYRGPDRATIARNIESAGRLGAYVCTLGWFPIIPHMNTAHMEQDRAVDPIDDNTYFVYRNAGKKVFVKHGPLFRDQGGLTQDWGKGWTRIKANSIEHARRLGEELLP